MPLSMININCAVATNFPRSRCDVAPYAPADCHGDNVAALERWNTVINHRVLSGFSQYTGPHEDTNQTLRVRFASSSGFLYFLWRRRDGRNSLENFMLRRPPRNFGFD